MIMFWGTIALFTLLILTLVLRPLIRQRKDFSDVTVTDYDTLVYKNQLEEVDRDHARGELTKEEAEAAKLEISRRLLAADAKQAKAEKETGISNLGALVVALVIAVSVSGGTVLFYKEIGRPGMPNVAFADRAAERETANASRKMPEIDRKIDALTKKVDVDPEDIESWMELAGLHMRMGDFVEAAFAFKKAMNIDRNTYGAMASYGEAMILAGNGNVSDEIRMLLMEAGQKFPQDPRPKFYIAQYEYQKGDPRLALMMLVALIKEASPDAAWVPAVRVETMNMARESGIDISGELPSVASSNMTTSGGVASEDRGPTSEDMADAAGMSTADRDEMISGMVDQLAGRLKEEPDDVAGWRKLARAATVLGREDQIIAAYDNLLRLEGESIDLLLGKADALMKTSKGQPTKEILEAMARVLTIDPNNPDALWFSAMAALSIGDKQKAEVLFNQSLASIGVGSPDYPALQAQAKQMLAQ